LLVSDYDRAGASPKVATEGFFTVETVRLKTLYVLFYIELHTRQVRVLPAIAYEHVG
jgi:hypothetical protein